MNKIIFKYLWNTLYKVLTGNGWNSNKVLGRDIYLRLYVTAEEYVSILAVGCRHNAKQGENFAMSHDMTNIEVVSKRYVEVEDEEAFTTDYQTSWSDLMKLIEAAPINWELTLDKWFSDNNFISHQIENIITVRQSKNLMFKLRHNEIINQLSHF